ncbi:MAG: glycosyltransferase family 4 protein [Cyclobacteriaceae bacterium]
MSLCVIPTIFIRAPKAALKFLKYERADGRSPLAAFKSLYHNAHILHYKLDWLHFGFATIAIGRENVARSIGAKMAVSLRGYDINVYPIEHPGCYELLWKRVDRVHSISNYLFQKATGLGLSKEVCYHIITPAVAAIGIGKTEYEFSDPVKIVTVARLTWIKGLTHAIEAMAKLGEQDVHVEYSIVGEGPDLEKLAMKISLMGLKREVLLLGKLPHEDTLDRMRKSDIYLQPSLNEGFCNSVLEAQALGCLCIASDVGALPENIVNSSTGWLVPPENAKELSNKIKSILQLPLSERKRIANNARKRVLEKFTMEQHMTLWNLFYYG